MLAIAAIVLLRRRGLPPERRGGAIAAAVGLAAIALPFALALVGFDFVDPRNLIGSLVPLLVAGGIAFGLERARLAGAVCAAIAAAMFCVVLVAVYVSSQMERPDWRGLAAAIGPPSGLRVVVVPVNGDDGLAYYLNAKEFSRRPFRGRGVRTRDIVVVSKNPAITPPGHGFKLVDRRRIGPPFTLRRYRSPRRVRIRYQEVAGNRVLMERSKVLVDGLGP